MNENLFAKLQEAARTRFKCEKCGYNVAVVDRIAVSGAGLSRFFDVQNRRLITVSCTRCGYTDVFNERAITGKSFSLSDVVDLFFGG